MEHTTTKKPNCGPIAEYELWLYGAAVCWIKSFRELIVRENGEEFYTESLRRAEADLAIANSRPYVPKIQLMKDRGHQNETTDTQRPGELRFSHHDQRDK